MKPEISVIMYVKNGMPYFKKALQSVICQTLYNIEILVIDGGSTDGTIEYTQACQNIDSRIRLLFSFKGSVGEQFNIGVREAKGKYIGIVESDDYILPEMYYEELACAMEYECDVLRADNYIFFSNQDEEIRLLTKVSHKDSNYNRNMSALNEPENVLVGGSFWTGLYKREFLIDNNIQMNETDGAAYQDFGFLFLTSVLADKVFIMPKAFYCYRKDNPISSCNKPDRLDMPIQEYHFLENELKQRGILEQYKEYFMLWKIRNEIWFYSNLEETMKRCYVHLLYKDLKTISKDFYSCVIFHDKEKEFLNAVAGGEDKLNIFFEQKDQIWMESLRKIKFLNIETVYFFGAGNIGRILYYFLRNHLVKTMMQGGRQFAYVDNASELWGTKLEGIPIMSPQETLQIKDAFFIICSENYAGEIYTQIRDAGVEARRIAICDDMDLCIRWILKERGRKNK